MQKQWDSSDIGGGGGGGVGGNPPGLATDAQVREFGTMLQVVSEGPIVGLVDGLKSVYLDGTPVMSATSAKNFSGIALALTAGTNTQAMIPGLTDAESETAVGVQVKIATGAVVRTISTSGISAIRVRLGIPSLKVINATDGSERGTEVQIKLERQSASYNGGAWEVVTLEGAGKVIDKFGSRYTKSYRIETPAAGPWSIRMTRLTPDHVPGSPDYTQDETWWDAYTEITDAKLRYPFSAMAAIKVDAKQFQSIPKLTMDMKGRIIQIPSNYNPTTRVYTGIWDGTFTTAWTDNPAWIWYDMASHTRYGAGTFLDAAKLDKWALYTIAQACDVMVSDGKGGSEPRFRCSLYLQNQAEAIKLLQEVASIFRGMIYWAGGIVTAVQDADASPVAIFTASNVKDGRFTYQGSARKSRHTAALVSWQDPTNGYETSVEYVEDHAAIARYGFNSTTIAALGATSQAQARRLGLWTLLTETMDTEVVTFSGGLEGSTMRPGNIIAVQDQFRAAQGRLGGRCASGATTTVIPLDAPVVLPAGTNTLTVRQPSGLVETRNVTTAAGTVSSLTVSPAFTAAPQALAQWALNVSLFRVLGVKKGDGLYYDITALQHTPSKYALIDTVTVTPGPATVDAVLTVPTGIVLSDTVRIEKDKLVQTLTAYWTGVAGASYYAEASQDSGPWLPMLVSAASASLDAITSGVWRVRVQSVSNGAGSSWATAMRTVAAPTVTATDAGAAAAAAAAAQSTANTASTNATNALSQLTNIASDSILSPSEKPAVQLDYTAITAEQAGIDAQADAYAVSRTAYDTAVSALTTYLGTLTGWNTIPGSDVAIVGTTFRSKFSDVYTARQALLNAIYAAAKALADAAQASANTAGNGVTAINSVDYLSNQDKIQLRRDWDAEQQIKTQLDAQATALGVSATAYDNAVAALSANLITAGAPAGWATTWPDGTTFAVTSIVINLRTWWSSIATNRASLQKALGDKIQANADYANAMAHSSNNLIKNGNSEDPNPSGPEAAGVVTYGYRTGTKCRLLLGNGSYPSWDITPLIPCSTGDQFYLEAWGFRTSTGTGNARVYLAFMNADRTTVAGSTTIEAVTTGYQKYTCSMAAPAGACYVFIRIENDLVPNAVECYWDDFYLSRKISAGMIQGDAIQTSNYAETAGNPTAGAKMDISNTALKVAAGNLQLGSVIFSDYLLPRILQALDGNATIGRVFYRGNNDTTMRGGAPNIARLTVTRRDWSTTYNRVFLELKIQPQSADDNLDGMEDAKVAIYRQSAAGTTAMLTGGSNLNTYFVKMPSRKYGAVTSDSNALNSSRVSLCEVDVIAASGFPACLVTLNNLYGPSDTHCFYSGSTAANDVDLVDNGTSWPAGITGGASGGSGGGGGGGGGGCPAPWVKIQLASGLLVDAADLYDGAQVAAVNDITLEPMIGIVRSPRIIWTDRVPITFEDGTVTEFSAPHRFMVESKDWTEARNLVPGDSIMAQQPSIVRCVGKPIQAQVVTFSVEGAHTYFADGLLSHNLKPLA